MFSANREVPPVSSPSGSPEVSSGDGRSAGSSNELERGLGSGSSRIGRTEKEGADGLTRGFGGYAPIFCRWDVLGRLWLTADALTVPSVGPKFRGGSWGGGASPAATAL